MLRRSLSLSVVVVLVIAACATTLKYQGVNLAQYLNFSHKLHAGEAACGDCHAGVEESEDATKGKFIGQGEHGGCADCHEVDEDDACGQCHKGSTQEVRLNRVDRHLKFSHALHDEDVIEGGCSFCHASATLSEHPGTEMIPGHDLCKTCHEQQFTKLQCDTCHRDLHRQSDKPSTMFSHQGNFIKRHGKLAQDAGRCAACHDQTYCADCHARTAAVPLSVSFPDNIEAGYIHRGDFIARHASLAASDPSTCYRCHGAQYCKSCHQLSGLAPSAPSATQPTATKRVHGPDIMQPGSPGFHGLLARRDISKCASCHDQGAASNCVQCHRVGALGGNPHPSNFSWSNKASECRNNGMCAACHIGGAGCR